MIDAPRLLADLIRQLKGLEDDLRARLLAPAGTEAAAEPALQTLSAELRAEWEAARQAGRCAETFDTWAEQVLTQGAVHWLLSCVFLRFIEDNALVERPWIGGTPDSGRLALARDRHETYFRAHPTQSDRDYLQAAFAEAGTLPGLHTFFDAAHNPVFRLPISGAAAMALREFWQAVDPNTGALVHDFTDAALDTRFLGDLYQDLSEATRKRYALLQTPEFVEEFILDRTLTPAIQQFGWREVRMIDPTCGSGHFLLGGFRRLVGEWLRHEPGRNPRDIAQKALDGVAGVDLNPFAVAIARFRLWVAALQVAEVGRLADAPDFKVHVAIGDSLLHGRRFGLTQTDSLFEAAEALAQYGLDHAYLSEDLEQVNQILGRQYHAVVGNPPYIVVGDKALNAAYRLKYASCHRQYSLGAPFTERFFELAVSPQGSTEAGHVGLITANSFMKREFGSKLIEEVLPRLDLTHVVDTSGAYIPGHGTPTVILFGRHRKPMLAAVRTVMGIKGEPSTPDDPARGWVWSAIVDQIDRPGSESEFISVADTPRATFGKHPWSLGGGGASELREQIEEGSVRLREIRADIGYSVITGEDNCLMLPTSAVNRLGFSGAKTIVEGDVVRDWTCFSDLAVLWPYSDLGKDVGGDIKLAHAKGLWNYRTSLKDRKAFGVPVEQKGLRWWDLREVYRARLVQPLTITFAEVATHNHFVLDRGGKVFKQTAPVIKLPAGSSEDEHLGLLGLLNSSVACFWLKQVCQKKGAHLAGKRTREERYAFNATNVAELPLPASRPLDLAKRLEELSLQRQTCLPRAVMALPQLPSREDLDCASGSAEYVLRQMIGLQEELDWQCYGLYGLLPENVQAQDLEHLVMAPIPVALGERAFEIVLARRMAAGQEQSTWFERHGSTPVTEVPAHWPEAYRRTVQRRIDLIESSTAISLLERPDYKRRWNTPEWEEMEQAALREWLLDRLEAPRLWPASDEQPAQLVSVRRLADAVAHDADFLQVAELYAGQAGFDLLRLVQELVAAESVPFLPVLRYTETGLRKRAQWQDTWTLQRQEDAIDARVIADNAEAWRAELTEQAHAQFGSATLTDAQAWIEQQLAAEIARQQQEDKDAQVGAIAVPPKYKSEDFTATSYWDLRGALDVPKERWISYPGCERGADGTPPLAWAGWTPLQQATALAGYLLDMKDNEGWEPARLQPLLAGLLELVPWLQQWHNTLDPVYGERMGDYFAGFVADQARALGFTLDQLRAWRPASGAVARKRAGRPRKGAA
ncbi:hypothetical protein ABIC99_003650 [Sphaerotilus sulfidivorans]|uniref:site-specific DNA-methyltransferase (adenine-specific) n=1 Tax=Sphaerotilus sulfidivorans TaxID=639200 RepID=A0ABV2IS83_9BURK